MTITNLTYKKNNVLYRTSITYPLNEWTANNPNTEYFVLTDSSFNNLIDCLKLENGVLSYDIELLKTAVHKERKEKDAIKYAPFDKIISDINALEIPESELNGTHSALKAAAEQERVAIRTQRDIRKLQINNSTTAEAILAIWQEIKNE